MFVILIIIAYLSCSYCIIGSVQSLVVIMIIIIVINQSRSHTSTSISIVVLTYTVHVSAVRPGMNTQCSSMHPEMESLNRPQIPTAAV